MQKIKEYKDDIFLLEVPEGGNIDEVHAVGMTGWQGTLQRQPTQPIRFYAQIIGFEDANAPMRNWQMRNKKFSVERYSNKPKASELEEYLEAML